MADLLGWRLLTGGRKWPRFISRRPWPLLAPGKRCLGPACTLSLHLAACYVLRMPNLPSNSVSALSQLGSKNDRDHRLSRSLALMAITSASQVIPGTLFRDYHRFSEFVTSQSGSRNADRSRRTPAATTPLTGSTSLLTLSA